MKKMSAFVVAAVVLVALTGCKVHLPVFGASWHGDLAAATNIVQTAEIPASLIKLELDNCLGSVRVTGSDSGPAHWNWNLTVRARTDAIAQQIARAVICESSLEDGHLKIVISAPDSREPHSIESNFEVVVPKAASVDTHNHFGRTEITSLGGEVNAWNQNGEIEIHNVSGPTRARTSFAHLNVSDTGPATLHDQNGEIMAAHIGGPLDADTSFGSLVAQDVSGHARLGNQNGEIKATAIRGALEANTSFGPIIAHDIGGPAHLRDQMGRIELTQAKGNADLKTSFDRLSVEGIEGDLILHNQNGEILASGVTGTVQANTSFGKMQISGAGAKFVCHNQNGEISLRATSPSVTEIDATTSFGSLVLHLPASVKPALQARTSFGDVESDFPVLIKSPSGGSFAEAGPGALRASLLNQNGDIRIFRD
ncbi:MAG: hypothetical protein ACLQVY_30765 [Limisphaerales bacterium]